MSLPLMTEIQHPIYASHLSTSDTCEIYLVSVFADDILLLAERLARQEVMILNARV
jgi:hypothetical protein